MKFVVAAAARQGNIETFVYKNKPNKSAPTLPQLATREQAAN